MSEKQVRLTTSGKTGCLFFHAPLSAICSVFNKGRASDETLMLVSNGRQSYFSTREPTFSYSFNVEALCCYTIVEFLASIHSFLPLCWYSLSVADLFGLTEAELCELLVAAGLLKRKGVAFRRM